MHVFLLDATYDLCYGYTIEFFISVSEKKEWPLLFMKLRLGMNSLKVHQLQI